MEALGAKSKENEMLWKALIRQGIPDKFKRQAIL